MPTRLHRSQSRQAMAPGPRMQKRMHFQGRCRRCTAPGRRRATGCCAAHRPSMLLGGCLTRPDTASSARSLAVSTLRREALRRPLPSDRPSPHTSRHHVVSVRRPLEAVCSRGASQAPRPPAARRHVGTASSSVLPAPQQCAASTRLLEKPRVDTPRCLPPGSPPTTAAAHRSRPSAARLTPSVAVWRWASRPPASVA